MATDDQEMKDWDPDKGITHPGIVKVKRKLLLALLPLQTAVKEAAKEAARPVDKVAARAKVKAAARVAARVAGKRRKRLREEGHII